MIASDYIDIENETSYDIDVESLFQQTEFMFRSLRLHPETEVSIILVDEQRMSQLHVEWMDEEGPTDVLSFPQFHPKEISGRSKKKVDAPGSYLGDLVISTETTLKQAKE